MGFYNNIILPRLCDLAMRNKQLKPLAYPQAGPADYPISQGKAENICSHDPGAACLVYYHDRPCCTGR
jgi:hypothetical protein